MATREVRVPDRQCPTVIRRVLTAAALVLLATQNGTAQSENPEIAKRRAAQQTSFSDRQIIDGFDKIAFRAELQFDRPVERIRKFDEPVRLFVTGGAAHRGDELAAIVADIGAHVNHLDLAMSADPQTANFVVTLVPKRDLARTIRFYYGPNRARKIQRRLRPQCLSGIGKDANYRIRRAEAIVPDDVDDFSFYDCAYEELLQGLGVINDDSSVPWTMFNDKVQMGFFDVYDQYLVNILYDPAVRPGMTKSEVHVLLPEILPKVRAWVAKVNPLERAN